MAAQSRIRRSSQRRFLVTEQLEGLDGRLLRVVTPPGLLNLLDELAVLLDERDP